MIENMADCPEAYAVLVAFRDKLSNHIVCFCNVVLFWQYPGRNVSSLQLSQFSGMKFKCLSQKCIFMLDFKFLSNYFDV